MGKRRLNSILPKLGLFLWWLYDSLCIHRRETVQDRMVSEVLQRQELAWRFNGNSRALGMMYSKIDIPFDLWLRCFYMILRMIDA